MDSAREQIAQKYYRKVVKPMRKLLFVVLERRRGILVEVLVTEHRDAALRCKNQCKMAVRYISERWEIA